MKSLNIHEAKAQLSSCLAQVARGETIVLCRRNEPVAEIRPIKKSPKKKRPLGLARKKYPDFVLDDRFFEPLPEEIIDLFRGKEG